MSLETKIIALAQAIGDDIKALQNASGGNTVTTDVLQSDVENGYIYQKSIIGGVHTISRFKDVEEVATNVTDIATDWANRETLNY